MNKTRVAINGFGRIGRTILRIILLSKNYIEVVAINDLGDYETLSYLLKYDTVFGVLNKEITIDNGTLVVGEDKHNIKLISERDPSLIPWKELDIDIAESCLAPFTFSTHIYEKFHLVIALYLCRIWRGNIKMKIHADLKWVSPSELRAFPTPAANAPLIAMLQDYL